MPGPARLKHKFSKSLSDLDNCSVVTEEFLIKPKMEKGGGGGGAKTPDCLFHGHGLLMTQPLSLSLEYSREHTLLRPRARKMWQNSDKHVFTPSQHYIHICLNL